MAIAEDEKSVLVVLPKSLLNDLDEVVKDVRPLLIEDLGKVTRSRVIQIALEQFIEKFKETGEIS